MRFAICLFFLLLVPQNSFCQDLSVPICSGINMIRSSNGLGVLRRDLKLDLAAKSQSDWMAASGRMDHLREHPKSLDEYRICNYHPANRIVNSGYFAFDELFRIDYNPSGAEVHPTPRANTHVGEIIAAGRGGGPDVRRPEIILQGWMNSPGHRQAILTPHFRDFGSGVSVSGGDVYWCVVFASRE